MVVLVLIYAILLYFSNVMARTASTSLFFGQYDAKTYPYTSIFLMFIGPLVSLVYLRLNNNFALSKVLVGIHIFLLVSLITLPLLLNRITSPLLVFALPIYFGVNNSLTISSFWNLLGRIYNLRQGKRLFGLLSSGEHMATIVAGFAAPLFVARIGTINLYWIGAVFMAATVFVLLILNRENSDKMDEVVTEKGERTPATGMGELLRERYVILIFALFTLFIVGILMVGNIAYAEAQTRFPTAEAMATYIGVFMGIFGVLSLIVQWFIAGRALDRFGVRSMIIATPIGLFTFMAAFALVGTFTPWTNVLFWLAAGAAMWQAILDAVDSAAVNLMYQPLPAQLRTQAQTTVIGIVYPVAIGLSGLLLIFLYDVLGFDSVQLSYATLIVIGIWIFVGLRLGRAYPRRLQQALQERTLGGLTLAKPDRSSMPVFVEALAGSQPGPVLYALDMISEVAPELLVTHLPPLLNHPSDTVRIAALHEMADVTWPEQPPGLGPILDNGDGPEVRAAALTTWYAIDPLAARRRLAELSADRQPEVRRVALALQRVQEDPQASQQAAAMLHELAGSAAPEDRRLAAAVIGDTAVPEDYALLLPLLEDDDPATQRAALAAAALARYPQAWPVIIPLLSRLHARAAAQGALAAAGEEIIPYLEAAAEAEAEAPVLAGIAAVCGRVGGPEPANLLMGFLEHPDPLVRHEALLALNRCGVQASPETEAILSERLRAEAALAAFYTAAEADIGSGESLLLVADALEQARLLQTDSLLLLLALLTQPQTVLSAREALRPGSRDAEKESYALEVLDILLDHDFKQMLFPYFQELDSAERLVEVQRTFPQEPLSREGRLVSLLETQTQPVDNWTRICAIYALGRMGQSDAIDAITEAAGRCQDDLLLVAAALNSLDLLHAGPDKLAAAKPRDLPAAQLRELQQGGRDILARAELLKNVGIFAQVPNGVLRMIAGVMEDVSVPSGQTVIQKGEPGNCLYVVADGELNVHDGDLVFETISRGAVAGEMALLDAQPRSASITAVSDSHLLRLDQEPFYDLLAGQPQVMRDLMALLSLRLRERAADMPAAAAAEEAARPVLPIVGAQPGMNSSVAVQGQLMDLDKVFVLKGVTLFGHSDDELLGQLAVLVEEVDLSGGEVLFEAGDPGRSLYIVAAGQVRVHVGEKTLAYLGEGEVFGEMALLESEPRAATVTAVVPTTLLRLDQQPFFELLAAQPELARDIIIMQSHRLRERLVAALAESTIV